VLSSVNNAESAGKPRTEETSSTIYVVSSDTKWGNNLKV